MSSILKFIAAAERWAAVFAFAIMTLALLADVISRRLFQTGLVGAVEIAVFGMIALAMFGIGVATDHGAHLRPTVFDALIPKPLRGFVERFASLVTGIFFLILTGFAVWIVAESFMLGDRTPILRAPVWALQVILLLAFASNAARFLIYFANPALKPVERVGGDGPPVDDAKDAAAPQAGEAR